MLVKSYASHKDVKCTLEITNHKRLVMVKVEDLGESPRHRRQFYIFLRRVRLYNTGQLWLQYQCDTCNFIQGGHARFISLFGHVTVNKSYNCNILSTSRRLNFFELQLMKLTCGLTLKASSLALEIKLPLQLLGSLTPLKEYFRHNN